MRVVPGGFGTGPWPHLRVESDALITQTGSLPLMGSYAELAAKAGVEASRLDDVYSGGPKIELVEQIEVDSTRERCASARSLRTPQTPGRP